MKVLLQRALCGMAHLRPRPYAVSAVLVALLTVAGTSSTTSSSPSSPTSIGVTSLGSYQDAVFGKQKRQIFREQVSPHTGGKIPGDAFRADRLALNRLNAAGISVPDGVLVQVRGAATTHHHDPVTGHSHGHDPHTTVIKIVQPSDGRYAPPEGAVHQQNTVDSTYLVRTPAGWNQHASQLIEAHEPVGPPLQLPGTSTLRRPFHPQKAKPQYPQQPPTPPPFQPKPPAPSPPPPAPHFPSAPSDVNLSPEPAPFPSPALQPPPNVPPPNLIHHQHAPRPQPPPPPPPPRPQHPFAGFAGLRPSLRLPHALGPVATSHQSIHQPRHHFSLYHQHLESPALSPLIDIDLSAAAYHDKLSQVAQNEASFVNSGLLHDVSFSLEDWATELPGGLLSPEQLAALYNSEHEEKLQHLQALASF